MKPTWLLKIKRYDGSESVIRRYDRQYDAEADARQLNAASQSSTHYVEAYDVSKVGDWR